MYKQPRKPQPPANPLTLFQVIAQTPELLDMMRQAQEDFPQIIERMPEIMEEFRRFNDNMTQLMPFLDEIKPLLKNMGEYMEEAREGNRQLAALNENLGPMAAMLTLWAQQTVDGTEDDAPFYDEGGDEGEG